MRKKNYSSWSIAIDDFPREGTFEQKMAFLIGYAILAPSSHNTQPWSFHIGPDYIDINVLLSRRLEASDPTGREMYISLGCCIENLLIVLQAFKIEFREEFFPNGQDALPVLRVKILNNSYDIENAKNSALLAAISIRHSNHAEHRLSEEDRLELLDIQRKFSDDGIFLIFDREERQKIAELISEGTAIAMNDLAFKKELSHWVKNNLTRSFVGMPCFVMGISTPISFLVPNLITHAKPSSRSLEKDRKVITDHTLALGILTADKDDILSWIRTGRVLENFILNITSKGFSVSFHTAPIEMGNLYKKLQIILGTNRKPLVLIRVGRALRKGRATPRLTVSQCLN